MIMKKILMLLLLVLTVTLVACDETPPIIEPQLYEYTFDVDGGTFETPMVDNLVVYGNSIIEPTVINAGYELVGWYSDSTYNVPYDFSQPVYGNLTIYALWEEVESDTMACDDGYTLVDDVCQEEVVLVVCPDGYALVDFICELEDVPTVLEVVFVPSRPANDILNAVGPLELLLKQELSDLGFDFDEVNVTVSSSYETGAESVANGNADIVFLPGSTYVMYSDGLVPILAAARDSLNKDSENPRDWNDGLPTIMIPDSKDAVYYRSLILAGSSTKGRELAAIVNTGGTLTWDDIKDAAFCHGSENSSASYIYPNLWLMENFGKSMMDLNNGINPGGYGASITALENETCDVAAVYGDARMHNFFIEGDAFELTDVIGVTKPIANDGIFVGAHIELKLAEALQIAFMNLIGDPDNESIFDIYSHHAYVPVSFLLYETAREVYDLGKRLD